MHRLGAVAAAAIFSLGLLSSVSALACGTGKVQFEDKFTAADPSWSLPTTDTSYGDSGFSYNMKPNLGVTKLNQSGFYDDYEVCAQVAMQFQPNSASTIGIAFWGTDENNLYTFDISPFYGTYGVWRGQRGKFLQPIKWTASDAIKKSSGDVNELSVAVKGKHAILFINGTKIAEFNGQPPDGGSLPGVDMATGSKDAADTVMMIKDIQVLAVQ
jgi:hypothetical protein